MFAFSTRRMRRRSERCAPLRSGWLETLEDRTLLTADVLAPLAEFPSLTVDADSYDPSSILVRYRGDGDSAATGDGDASLSLLPGLSIVHLDEGVLVADALAAYESDPLVLYAEPNYHIQLEIIPDDTQFDELWGLNNVGQTGGTFDADIDAPEAWELTTGSGAVTVAVIDTGVDYTHPDLASNIWVNPGEIAGDGIDNDGNGYVDDVHGYDFINHDGDPMDDHNHGTHVAGTIGSVGNDGLGVSGINWDVEIMALKFLSSSGSGSISDAIEALNYAVANGAMISNNSWGFNGTFSQALHDAIESARDAGHVFVAAAGNGNFVGVGLDNDVTPFWPANHELDNVVAVAATDHNDQIATFSNYGATTVDLGAPGVGILSTTIGNTYSTFSGTSMATPHVTGVLSLLWDQHPEWSYQQVIDRLYETVEPIAALDGITVTGGRLNAALALGPDVTGPQIVSTDPSSFVFDPVSSLRVQFSEAVNPATFTTADIISFTGPNGSIAVDAVIPVAGSSNRVFEVSFTLQDELGPYRIVFGSNITDLAGNLLDQDRDGTGGEPADDEYSAGFDIVPFFANLDFGTSTSPVAAGYQRVDPSSGYTAERGFGWTSGSIDSRDRGESTGDDLSRDFNFFDVAEFVVDVPDEPGLYEVTLTMGDGLGFTRDEMGVFLEGVQFDSVTASGSEYAVNTYLVTVADGQLTLLLDDLGGADPVVMINGLVVQAVGPDLNGPRVIDAQPTAELSGSVDRFTLSFNEAIDPATFTPADVVSLTGPAGAIAVEAVNSLSETQFEVVFASQSELGDYSLTIGPDITDVVGNLMDQDQDLVNGETPDDRYTTSITLVQVTPFEAHFDFGTTSSPVAADYERIAQTTSYSSAQGFGWLSGSIDSRDRGASTGDDVSRDFNFTQLGTFAVDVPSQGVYEVTLTMGDGLGYTRDEMGVFLEGIQFDSVTSSGSEYAVNTYQVTVTDGQLTLLLDDLGGSDPLVMINGLDVVTAGLDDVGPHVVAAGPAPDVSGSLDRVSVTFSEAVDSSSFTVADVISLTGPGGVITPIAVNSLTATDFEVTFAPQTELGTYSLTIGPDITDLVGNAMDQDADGIPGEVPDDRFTASIDLVPAPPFEAHFDFGTTSSPVAAGYEQIAHTTTYSQAEGFGWLSGSVDSRDRGSSTGDDLTRDFNFTQSATFVVDVPSDGVYEVTLTMGDGLGYTRDEMGVFLEGIQFDSVTSNGTVYAVNTYQVTVTDGQLTLLLEDLGGSDPLVMINGLDVMALGPDTAGPRVIAVDPAEEVFGSLDRMTVTFDEAIDAGTFTLVDVVSLTGPGGPIDPLAVNAVSGNEFEIVFAPQTADGDYALVIGPDIADVSGNLMDQDGDGNTGEAPDDRYIAAVSLVSAPLFEAHFDFGTNGSPVAAGYERVAHTTYYSAEQGFGWLQGSGSVNSRDRGASRGDDLSRDFNFTRIATFLVDVPDAGEYDITLTMGDGLGYVRDQMGIFVEGVFVDSVTSSGSEYAVNTYRVTVTDGQLTLLLDDLGGDPLVMINGLDVAAVPTGGQASAIEPAGSTVAAMPANPLTRARFNVSDFTELDQFRRESGTDRNAAEPAQFMSSSRRIRNMTPTVSGTSATSNLDATRPNGRDVAEHSSATDVDRVFSLGFNQLQDALLSIMPSALSGRV